MITTTLGRYILVIFLIVFSYCLSNAQMKMSFDVKAGQTIKIPDFTSTASYSINWGDGSTTNNNASHRYTSTGRYQVRINTTGDIDFEFQSDSLSQHNLVSIDEWGGLTIVTPISMFEGCINLKMAATDAPTFGINSNLNNFFRGCENLEAINGGTFDNWDMRNVRYVAFMFRDCLIFNEPINGWQNTGNIRSFTQFFYRCRFFNQPLDNLDVSGAIALDRMFQAALRFNQPIGNWDVGLVSKFDNMFRDTRAFNQPLNNWNTALAKDMSFMFEGADNFNQPLNNWNTSNVTDMSNMFLEALSFNQPLDGFDVSSVTNFDNMFGNTPLFDQDLNGWDVGEAKSMEGMFSGAQRFNQDLTNWDVRKVETMKNMFSNTTLFNGQLGTWASSSVTDMSFMFANAKSFNRPLNGLDVSSVRSFQSMFEGAIQFNQDLDAWDTSDATNMSSMFKDALVFNGAVQDWNTGLVRDMSYMFSNADAFNPSSLNWDVRSVISFGGTFAQTDLFNADLSSWQPIKATYLASMFEETAAFNNNSLKNWNTPLINNLAKMFRKAALFSPDSLNWNTSNVTNVSSIFSECSTCNPVIEAWDIRSVTNVDSAFYASGLTLENYDKTLISWGNQDAQTTNDSDWKVPVSFCFGADAQARLKAKWVNLTDQGNDCSAVVTPLALNRLSKAVSNDLVAWFKADTGIVASNGEVDQWLDISLYSGHLSDIGTTKFEYDSSAINFNPVIQNPLINNRRLVSEKVLPIRTMFIVSNPSGTHLNGIISKKGEDEGNIRLNDANSWFIPGNGDDFTRGNSSSSARVNGESNASFDSSHILTVEAAELMIYQNGLEVSTLLGSSRFWGGDIAEIIAYADVLTAEERSKIESYLAIKYGITLDQSTPTNYVSPDGAIVWDASTAGIFKNNIIGIGRSDSIQLNQLVSKSISEGDGLRIASSANFAKPNTDKSRVSIAANESYCMVADNGMPYDISSTSTDVPSNVDFRLNKIYKISLTNFNQALSLKFEGFDNQWKLIKNSSDLMAGATVVGGLDADGQITTSALVDGDYFSLAKSSNAPGGIASSLGLWLRPESGTSTTVDGANVTDWEDSSFGITGSSAGYGDSPQYTERSINFNPSIYFPEKGNTGDMALGFGSEYFFTPASAAGMHIFVVGMAEGNEPWNLLFDCGLNQSNSLGMLLNTNTAYGISGNQKTGGAIDSELALLEYDLNFGGTKSTLFNGKVLQNRSMVWPEYSTTQVGESNVQGYDFGPFTIGRQAKWDRLSSNGGRYFRGHIGDFIIYQGAKDDIEIAKIQSYLAIKYGISLDQTTPKSYISSVGDTIWNANQAGVYNHNIFGLGRDDASLLDQRISQAASEPNSLLVSTASDFVSANGSGRTTISNEGSFFMISDNGAPFDATSVSYNVVDSFPHRLEKLYTVQTLNFSQAVNLKFEGFNDKWYLIKSNSDDMTLATTVGTLSADGVISTALLQDGDFFTLAREPFSAPGGVTREIGLWLRPEEGTNTTTDGAQVTTWSGQISPSLEGSSSGYGDSPQYAADSINFNPSIYFPEKGSSADMALSFGSEYFFTPAEAEGMHIFVVGKPQANNTWNLLFDIGRNVDNSLGMTLNENYLYGISGNQITGGTIDGDLSIVEYDLNFGGAKNTLYNGKLVESKPMSWPEYGAAQVFENPVQTRDSGPFTIGRQSKWDRLSSNGGRYYRGHIGDFIIYQGAKDDIEIAKIQSYLAIKYGITLDQTTPKSYIDTASDTIWDASRAGIYQHGIFGLAKDRLTFLDQRVSKSASSAKGLIVSTDDNFTKVNDGTRKGIEFDRSYFMISDNGSPYTSASISTNVGQLYEHRLKKLYTIQTTNFEQPIYLNFDGFDDNWVLLKGSTDDMTTAKQVGFLDKNGSIRLENYSDGDYFTLAKVKDTSITINTISSK